MVVTGLFLRQLSAALLCPLVLVCNRMDRTPILAGLALLGTLELERDDNSAQIAGMNRPFFSNWTASSTVHA